MQVHASIVIIFHDIGVNIGLGTLESVEDWTTPNVLDWNSITEKLEIAHKTP